MNRELWSRFLSDERGESIGEVLAAFAIAALAVAMFAGMLSVSTNIVDDSRTRLQENYASSSKLLEQTASDSGRLAISLTRISDGTVSGASISVGSYPIEIYSSQNGGAGSNGGVERFELEDAS